MSGDALENTEETLDDLIERLEGAINSLTHVVAKTGEHTAALIDALVSLDPQEAVGEVAEAADDAISGTASAASETVGAGVDAVKTPVDVVQDVAKPLESRKIRRGLRWRNS